MSSFEEKLRLLAVDLYKINAIKFGEFKTKIGLMTPVYCDLRVIVSSPHLMNSLADLITEHSKNLSDFDVICGVPYTALPIATVVSLQTNIPMVMRRKEVKDYGTKKLIEGIFNKGDKCLIIEDVVTSGSSILETVADLKSSQIDCADAIVLLNRQQGGEEFLKQNGIKMHALLTLSQLMQILREENCVDDSTVMKVKDYLASTQVDVKAITQKKAAEIDRLKISYIDRVKFAKNKMAQEIFQIMDKKKTNLCVAADLTTTTEILNLAEQVGPHICLFKTHIDILTDFHPNFLKHLQSIAENHKFLLFEDRKFSDIGKTVQLQYSEGVYKISSWAKIVTTHSVTGKGVLDAIKESPGLTPKGVFLLAETSAAGSLIDENYTKSTVKLGLEYESLVCGFVCQSKLFVDQPGLIQLTPGVQLGVTKDELSQQYNGPEKVVLDLGADVAVVGRGITQANDPRLAAEKYKTLLWDAYEKRIDK